MKNSIRKRYAKFHFTLAAVAILFTFITYLLLVGSLNRYTLDQTNKYLLADHSLNIYKDLDHNGSCERIALGKATTSDTYFAQLYNENGTVREQFNFMNPMLQSSTHKFDFDEDNYDELIIFTKNDSSLFMSIIDVKNNNFLEKEVLLLKRPKEVTTKFWDLNTIHLKFADLDKDGFFEMYLSPLTGHSIYPRGLFVYDAQNFTLKHKFSTTAPVGNFFFYDLDNDGFEDIIMEAVSSGNTEKPVGIHDHANWILYLDRELKLMKKPFQIGEFLNSISIKIVKYKGEDTILLIFTNKKSREPKEFFAILDFNYNVISKKELSSANKIAHIFKDQRQFASTFYVSYTSGEIAEYDLQFNKINSLILANNNNRFITQQNILHEEGNELIIVNEQSINVLSDNLELLISKSFDSVVRDVSIKTEDQNINSSIVVTTQNSTYVFEPKENLVAKFRIPLFILTSVFYFFLLLFLHRLFSRVSRVLGAYNYSYDDVNLGIIITDYIGDVKSYNKNLLYNLPPDSSIQKNKSIFGIFNKTPEVTEVIYDAFKFEKEISKDVAFTKNEFRFIGKIQVLPLFTLFRIPHSFVIKVQNMTKEIEGNRSAVWARIAQKVAHDIKTPLSTIQLNLTALKSRINESAIPDKAPLNDDIEMIHEEIKQISSLTRSFLKLSSLEKPNLQWTTINELIDNSIKPFKKYFENGISFEYEIQQDLSSIWADPNQMIQLFHIFIENSIDAIETRGYLKISVDVVEDLQHSSGSYVEFLITDNGKGLTREEKNKIFEPYFTQKKDGTGMGLTIAKKIIEDHGGSIDVKTKVNFGTTFIIKIPHNRLEDHA